MGKAVFLSLLLLPVFLLFASRVDAGDAGSVKNEGESTVRVRVERSNEIDFQLFTLPPGVSYDLPRLAKKVNVFPDPLDPGTRDADVSVRLEHPDGTVTVIDAYKKPVDVQFRSELQS